MLLHLLDEADTVNARFLYMRAPEYVKKTSKNFALVWSVVGQLETHNYEKAFELLDKPLSSAGKEESSTDSLRELLVWYLKSYKVPKFIAKTYSSIKKDELKKTMGQDKKSDEQAKQFMQSLGLVASESEGFVNISHTALAQIEADQAFKLDETRVQQLS